MNRITSSDVVTIQSENIQAGLDDNTQAAIVVANHLRVESIR